MFGLFRWLFADTSEIPFSQQDDGASLFGYRDFEDLGTYLGGPRYAEHRVKQAQKRQARAGIAAIRRKQEEKLFSFFFDQANDVSPTLLTKIEKLILNIERRDDCIINGDEFWAGLRDDDIRPVIQELEQLRSEILNPKDPEVEVKTSSTEGDFTEEDLRQARAARRKREAKAKGWNDDTNLERFKLN